MTAYEVKYYSASGAYLTSFLAYGRLELARREREVGALSLTLPDIYPDSIWRVDNRLEVWRAVPGGAPYLEGECAWLLRKWQYERLGAGGVVKLIAVDGVDILRRRIVAYSAGSEQASKTGAADDILRAIVRENLGALAEDSARDLGAAFLVEADASAAPVVTKEFSRRTVLDALREFCDAAQEAGAYLTFDVTGGDGGGAFTFHVYTGQRGANRGQGSASPLTLSETLGTLAEPVLAYDYLDEVNYAYAGGQGEGDLRVVVEASDPARVAASPYNRCETFRDSRNTENPDALAAEAAGALAAGRPKLTLTARVVDGPSALYGVHYHYGDLVIAAERGVVMDGHISTVHITYERGAETLDVRFEGEANL